MRSARRAILIALVSPLALCACGARSDVGVDDDVGGAVPDGGAADAGTALDARMPDTGPRPPTCVGGADAGGIEGFVPPGDFSFRFVAAGVEPDGSHSCPRFFLRAGEDPTFAGDHLEIEVPYEFGGPRLPGRRTGQMSVFIGTEVWTEAIEIDVQRADGLLDRSVPMDRWRGSAEIHYHDATTDLEAVIVDATYCYDFPLCI